MNAAAVHQDDHLAPEMTQQGAKKDGDLDRGDVVVGMHVQVEPHPVALGTDGDGGDRGDLVACVAVPDDRRLPARCPRPPEVRDQQESALFDKTQMGPSAAGRFFYRGPAIPFPAGDGGLIALGARAVRASGTTSSGP